MWWGSCSGATDRLAVVCEFPCLGIKVLGKCYIIVASNANSEKQVLLQLRLETAHIHEPQFPRGYQAHL